MSTLPVSHYQTLRDSPKHQWAAADPASLILRQFHPCHIQCRAKVPHHPALTLRVVEADFNGRYRASWLTP